MAGPATAPQTEVMMGNHALSHGALRSRVQVIAAYPITPQTQVVELLSEMCASGRLAAEYIKVESEHSAMAACIGAAAAGARSFTATSSQGLALMHELLHWAAGSRLPVVMGNINRAMGPPWNIWDDQTDSLAQRDTGWMQIYCADNQEVLDSVPIAFRVAERVMLPCMIVLDAFILSHTAEIVDVRSQAAVDAFLPPYAPRWRLDVADPRTFGALTEPEPYYRLRFMLEDTMQEALTHFDEAHADFAAACGRRYDAIECYRHEDADLLIVTAGALAGNARAAVDRLREEGLAAGLLRIRLFRPFPVARLRALATRARRLCVLDRNISFGAGGIFAQEIRSALYGLPGAPEIRGHVAGLGGAEVTTDMFCDMARETARASSCADLVVWKGLRDAPQHSA